MTWEKIVTCPRTRPARYLAFSPVFGTCIREVRDDEDDEVDSIGGPTHWMPLPAPPSDEL